MLTFRIKSYFKKTIAMIFVVLMMLGNNVAQAADGAQFVAGLGTIQRSGNTITITCSNGSIIKWDNFNISLNEIARFIQPGVNASVLNRILSESPTNIDGTLLANGRVFIINPAGVIFGGGAKVNVSQLVASSLNISNSDFVNGRYEFAGKSGAVINRGDIVADKVSLIGRQVINSGTISSPNGYVMLAAGDKVFLGENGREIFVRLDGSGVSSEPALQGTGIVNESTGSIDVGGGALTLAAGDIYSQAISNVGDLSASFENGDAGNIQLNAAGNIANSGTITASGAKGGSITFDGADVTLTGSSKVHADGADAGGEIRILADTFNIGGEMTARGTADAHGHILIDPERANIVETDTGLENSILVSDIIDDLSNNTDVTVLAEETINVRAAIDMSGDTVSTTTLSLSDDNIDGLGELIVNLEKTIALGANQTLTGDATTVNVKSVDASIQNGIDVAVDGAIITVEAAGTYTEDLKVDKSGLTLRSVNGRDNTAIQLVDGVGIDIGSGGSDFILGGDVSSGFEILSGGTTTFEIQLTNAPSGVEISGNRIDTTGNASQGISVGAAGATGLNINNNDFIAGSGDGSIWGPDVVDVSVTGNTFTGPASQAASGYAVQFSGVTGDSFIQDNNIDDYGMGIVISNGTGTSDLEIDGNTVNNSRLGVLLAQYSPGSNGDMTTVELTGNTLTNNTTGLQINNGANVKAGDFTIQENSFSGNATGLANQHASESVTAIQNYWGHVDGPVFGDPVTGDVDYSPWWGGDYIGDAHTTSWTWGTNDSIQDAIDLASTSVVDRINITAGSYSGTVNVNKQLDGLYFRGDGTAVSEIDGTLTLSDDVAANTGIEIYTQNNGELTLDAVSDAGTHSLLVDAGIGRLNLDEKVEVNGGVLLDAGAIYATNNITGDGVTFGAAVTANGIGAQTFDAKNGALVVGGAINKTGGDITLLGDTLIDVDGAIISSGWVNVGNADSTDIRIAANIRGSGINFAKSVTADGTGTQTFDSMGNTLIAADTIDKTGGDLTLTGAGIDLDGTVNVDAGSLVITDQFNASGDLIASDDVTFDGAAFLDGAAQRIDAETGVLTASKNIVKNNTGDLTLGGGGGIALGGDVAVEDSVTFEDAVTLGSDTIMTGGNVRFDDTLDSDLGNSRSLVVNASGITSFGDVVGGSDRLSYLETDAAGTTQIGAGSINLNGPAKFGDAVVLTDDLTINEAGFGDVEFVGTVNGAYDLTVNTAGVTKFQESVGDGIVLRSLETGAGGSTQINGGVTVAEDIRLNDYTTVADGKTLTAGNSIIVADGKVLTALGDLILVAADGSIRSTAGKVQIDMSDDDKTLRLTQNDSLDMDNFVVTNDEDTHLVAEVTNGGFDNANADQWKSNQAKASANVIIAGSGDIIIGTDQWTDSSSNIYAGDVISTGGGVSIISDNGGIYDSGSYDYAAGADNSNTKLDNVTISATNGVDLPGAKGEAAIVIQSEKNLNLGDKTSLSSFAEFTSPDDRSSVFFTEEANPIDVAIYLRGANIDMDATVSELKDKTAMVFDALTTVEFGSNFENSMLDLNNTHDIEVVSRNSNSLAEAQFGNRLPYVDDPDLIKKWFSGDYVLRGGGGSFLGQSAFLLAFVDAYPPEVPSGFMPEDEQEIETEDVEGLLQWLIDEGFVEGDVQAYLSDASSKMYATDLRPYKAAEKIKNYKYILDDEEGTRLANLGALVNKYIASADEIPSEEQFASIVTEMNADGVQYAAAKEWLDTIVETAGILTAEIGQSRDDTVLNLIKKYQPEIERNTNESVAMFFGVYISQFAM